MKTKHKYKMSLSQAVPDQTQTTRPRASDAPTFIDVLESGIGL